MSNNLKSMYRSLFFFIIVLFNVQSLHSQWLQTDGPNGGYILCLAVSGSNIFAGTEGGVFRSTNGGINWTFTGLPNTEVRSLLVNGTNIMAGIYKDGIGDKVFESNDNGANWTSISNGLGNVSYVNALTVSGNTLLAGTDSGVYYTTNNGLSWNQSNNILNSSWINSFTFSGSNIISGTAAGVYLSSDSGTDWMQVNGDLTNTNVYSLAANGTNIYAGTGGGGIFLTTNNGTNWTLLNNGPATSVNSLVIKNDNIYAGTFEGVYHSSDFGSNWTQVNNGLTTKYVLSLAVVGNDIFAGTSPYFSGTGGVYISTNNGISWTLTGLPNTYIISLTSSSNNIFAGTNNEGIYMSSNNGADWNSTGLKGEIYSLASSGTNIFAGTFADVFFSGNNGTTWTGAGLNANRVYSIAASGNNIYAGAYYNGVYHSTDNGLSWSNINNGLTDNHVKAVAINGDNIYAGTLSSGVFLSTNNGTDWTQTINGLTDLNINVLAASGTNIVAGTGTGGVYVSKNNGGEWSHSNLTGTNVNAFAVSGNVIFAGTNGGVFVSSDNGSSWTQINSSLPAISIYSLSCDGTDIYAGTNGAGIWRRPLTDFALPVELTFFSASSGNEKINLVWNTATELNNRGFDVERSMDKSAWVRLGFVKGSGNSTIPIIYSYVDKSVSRAGKYYYRLKQIDNNGEYKYSNVEEVEFGAPAAFVLNQNYPNPFNPRTRISYALKDKGFVKLKVFDIRGELVKTLVNESKDAGYYESEFDGKGLASGVYIYRLEVIEDGNKSVYSDIKKSVLLK